MKNLLVQQLIIESPKITFSFFIMYGWFCFVSFNDHMENLPPVGLGSPLERSRNMKLIENV